MSASRGAQTAKSGSVSALEKTDMAGKAADKPTQAICQLASVRYQTDRQTRVSGLFWRFLSGVPA